MNTNITIPKGRRQVSERALIQRINRALAKESLRLKVCREDSKWFTDLGRYYLVTPSNSIDASGLSDLEGLARELKVLASGEELAQ